MWKLLLATALMATLIQPNAAASGRGPCTEERYEVKHSMSTEVQHRNVKRLIRCAVRRWAVEGGAPKAIAIAECESSLYSWASGGGNDGLFQINNWTGARSTWLVHRHWYWPRWVNTDWKPGPFHARANVIVSIRWAHALGWDAWACAA